MALSLPAASFRVGQSLCKGHPTLEALVLVEAKPGLLFHLYITAVGCLQTAVTWPEEICERREEREFAPGTAHPSSLLNLGRGNLSTHRQLNIFL